MVGRPDTVVRRSRPLPAVRSVLHHIGAVAAVWRAWVSTLSLLVALAAGCGADGGSPAGLVDAMPDVAGVDADSVVASDEVGDGVDTRPDPDVSGGDADGGPAVLTILSVATDRPAPADLLFLRVRGEGLGEDVRIEGLRRDAPLLLDRDDVDGDDFPFSVVLRDADDREVWRQRLREPIQIREFLALAPLPEGFDLFTFLPEFGDLAVKIPRDAGATTVAFERRELDGSTSPLGQGLLADVPEMPRIDLESSPVTRIHGPDDPAEAVDVVLLADGYTAAEMDRFHADADRVVAAFLAREPYATFADRLAFHRVDTVSAESGAGFDCSHVRDVPGCRDAFKDTAFRSFFPLRAAVIAGMDVSDRNVIQRGIREIYQVASVVPYDAVIVLVNTPKYGAFGLYHASLSTGVDFVDDLVVHEFTHAFALLGDEYLVDGDICQHYTLTPDYPNFGPLTTDPAAVKWSAWLTPGVPLPTPADDPAWRDAVGLFAGAGGACPDMYRPTRSCLMRAWGVGLCPVCQDAIVRRIHRHVDVVGPAGVVVRDGALWADLPPDTPVIGSWTVDGTPAGPADGPLPLTVLAVGSATHDVRLHVRVDTPFVRLAPEELGETVVVRVGPAAD